MRDISGRAKLFEQCAAEASSERGCTTHRGAELLSVTCMWRPDAELSSIA